MSRMQLYVFFDKPDGEYRCGDTVSGRIKITALEDTRINKLNITPMWRTHGRGNVTNGKLESFNLFTGTWHQGETYEYHFSFDTPQAPHTCIGELVNVDWFLRIHPDVPFELDDKPEEIFTLKPALENPIELSAKAGCSKASSLLMTVFLVPFFGAGLFFMYLAGGMILKGETPGFFVFIFAFIFACVPSLMFIKIARQFLADYVFGGVTLHVEPQKTQPGNTVRLQLQCKPKATLSALTIQASIQAQERATSGSGTNVSHYHHTIFENELPKVFSGELKARLPFSHTFEIPIPDITPATLHLRDNQVKTAFHIKLRTDRHTWEGSQEVIVGGHL